MLTSWVKGDKVPSFELWDCLFYRGPSDLCIAQFISRGQAGIWDSSSENALSQGGCRTSVSRFRGGGLKTAGGHTPRRLDLLPPLVLFEGRL